MKYILITLAHSMARKEILDNLSFHNVDYELRTLTDPLQIEVVRKQFAVDAFPLLIETTGEVVGGIEEILRLFPAPAPIEGDGPEVLKITAIREGVKLPSYGSKESAGLDLCMHSVDFADLMYPAYSLKPGNRHIFNTGLVVSVPKGFYGRIAPRSGLAVKSGIHVLAGVVDSDYRGEIKVVLHNLGNRSVEFQAGDKIAQFVIEKISRPMIKFISNAQMYEDLTVRGLGGFGSTGA